MGFAATVVIFWAILDGIFLSGNLVFGCNTDIGCVCRPDAIAGIQCNAETNKRKKKKRDGETHQKNGEKWSVFVHGTLAQTEVVVETETRVSL